MSLTLKPVQKNSSNEDRARRLMQDSFPPHELMPFWLLMCASKKKGIEFLAVYDEELFVGCVYLAAVSDLTLILYLAIDSTIQSKGYGSRILSEISTRFPDNRVALDIEQLDPNSENYEQRVQRKAFYEKNGFSSTGYMLIEAGYGYEIMARGGAVGPEDYRMIYRRFLGPFLSLFSKPRVEPLR